MADIQYEPDPSKYPGFTGIGYPDVFTTMPPQPSEKKVGQLPPEKVKEFFEQGFTVVQDFFISEEIQPVKESFGKLVDDIAQKLYKTGRVKNLYEDHGLGTRLIMLEKEWPGAVLLLLKLGKLTPEFRALYQSEKLLNAMEQLLGPDIAANPVWNTRPKTPSHAETHVGWHQDSAFFDHDSYQTLIATAWTAFVDVTEENGCLQFARGAHKKGLVGVHKGGGEKNFYVALDEEEIKNRFDVNPETDFINAPVKAGGVVFFSNIIPHRSIPNLSDQIRWAMDFRYQSPHRPWGFFGLKSGILLRSSDQQDLKPDWDFYDNQDRYAIQKDYEIQKVGHGNIDEFDTTLTGPQFELWKIEGRNRHVDQFFDEKAMETDKQ